MQINYEKELNKEQLEVVFSNNNHSLVLAGPGSGKTRVLVYRISYLIDKGVKSENILLLTFTNKAAKNMIQRTTELLGNYPNGIFAGTFHHVGNIILRRHPEVIGFSHNFTIIDNEDSRNIIKDIINNLNIKNKKAFPSPSVIFSINSYSKNSLIDLSSCIDSKYKQLWLFKNQIIEICSAYESKKKKQNIMDFDDLLFYWNKLLDNENIKRHYSRQFTNILVDEFQDTNKLQFDIIKKLSDKNNIMVVGDDCQSIYSFRAAEIKNILEFPKNYQGCKEFQLIKNYRSTPEILNLINNSIKNNNLQFKKTLSTENKNKDKPTIVKCENLEDEAKYIIEKIKEINRNEYGDTSILFRADYHSANIELELMKNNINFKKVGGLKFFEQAHIKDITSFLKIFANSKDELSWKRILVLFEGIGDNTASKIWDRLNKFDNPINQITRSNLNLSLTQKPAVGWNNFINIIKLSSDKKNPSDLIDSFFKNFYKSHLQIKYPNFKDRVFDVKQYMDLAEKYKSVSSFLHDITLDADLTNSESHENSNKNLLTLSTIHQAKGLEWKNVFVISLAENRFPMPIAYQNDNIEEERRLFYVACSRAKENLYLTIPLEEFTHWGGYNGLDESIFITELPKNCYKEIKQ